MFISNFEGHFRYVLSFIFYISILFYFYISSFYKFDILYFYTFISNFEGHVRCEFLYFDLSPFLYFYILHQILRHISNMWWFLYLHIFIAYSFIFYIKFWGTSQICVNFICLYCYIVIFLHQILSNMSDMGESL
jgi:hypothetical protein